ncbi:hypothetical protein ACFLKB_01915 [Clostridium sp. FAM 1755]|uniref:hypothetical protein n=1 Tax=Clostridium TaxID=1485 RepID=UPI0013D690B8|nr:hypothetical protein [Clostridium sporogenes]
MMIKEFKRWLKQGREIEFLYNNNEYFIGNYEEGRAIFKGNERKSKYYIEIDKFLVESSIDGRLLKDILVKEDLKIITIF